MKIKEVKYGELRSDNRYNNREMAFVAEVDDDEKYEDVLAQLKVLVVNELSLKSDIDTAAELKYKSTELERVENELNTLQERLYKFKDWVDNNQDLVDLYAKAVDVDLHYPDWLPF